MSPRSGPLSSTPRPTSRPGAAATVGTSLMAWAMSAAALSVAAHVLGKAVRDALFLAHFPVEQLPWFVIGTGLVSALAVSGYTRLNAAFGPHRVVPALALLTAATLPIIWLQLRHGLAATMVILFVWVTVSGTFLTSGFWAVLAERLDPRTARRLFGWFGVATTVGGLVAGVGARGLLAVLEPEALLLVLAGLAAVLAVAMFVLGRAPSESQAPTPDEGPGGLRAGAGELLGSSYLTDIALLVTAVTVAGTLADYVLKDAAVHALSGKRELAEFFSLFHGIVGGATLFVQVAVSRPLVARKGLYAGLVALPLWLTVGGALLVGAPQLLAAAVFRGGENAVRNSFHRSGYELLFVPLSARTRRLTKPILDTLLDRVADALGAGVVLVVVGALGLASSRLGWVVVALAVVSLHLATRIRRGYVETLSANLSARALELEQVTAEADDDPALREAIHSALLDVRHAGLRQTLAQTQLGKSLLLSARVPESEPAAVRPSAAALADLTSSDPEVVRRALATWEPDDRSAVPVVVALLERDDVHLPAMKALGTRVDRVAGALVDWLDDPEAPFPVRRRIPRVLASSTRATALDGLVRGLADARFEVRYQCAAALERRALAPEATPGPAPPPDALWAAVRAELKKSRAVWEAERLLDVVEDERWSSVAGVVHQRGAHSLRHVFRLLGLLLDARAIGLCYRALGEGDVHFRAVGLEYLENVLPADVRRALWPLIGDEEAAPVSRTGRALEQVLRDLAASSGGRAAD